MTGVPLKLGAVWRLVRDQFRVAGIASATLDAQVLAQMAFKLDSLGLAIGENNLIDATEMDALQALADRRLTGEPVARIVGHKEFYGLRFDLNADTLVPRPETELLVERALQALPENSPLRLLDLGTGSGCVAISLLVERPKLTCIGVDISATALAQAAQNAHFHDVGKRLETVQGSWFDPLKGREPFDLIVSNPPYIDQMAMNALDKEVRDFDPHRALAAGLDGLDAYRLIVGEAATWLNPSGQLMVEIGFDQGLSVGRLFANFGFQKIEVHKDLAGLDRVVVASR